MMGSMLKSDKEQLTIIINGGGAIGTIMVDAYSDGHDSLVLINSDIGFSAAISRSVFTISSSVASGIIWGYWYYYGRCLQ